jgi:putative ABC transport system ATP-binding protein
LTDAPLTGSPVSPAVKITQLRFRWQTDQPWVLDIPSFTLAAGERLFLAGPSGSGKSTLLSLIAGISGPVEGQVAVLGTELTALSGPARDHFRADHLGVIFQMFNLLPYLTVLENVILPCRFSVHRRSRAIAIAGSVPAEARRLLAHLGLDEPGLEHRAAAKISVGQQQRVAAARALIGRPALILADEPTSALDADRQRDFIELLLQECASVGAALLFVSHDRALERHFDRVVEWPASTLHGLGRET